MFAGVIAVLLAVQVISRLEIHPNTKKHVRYCLDIGFLNTYQAWIASKEGMHQRYVQRERGAASLGLDKRH